MRRVLLALLLCWPLAAGAKDYGMKAVDHTLTFDTTTYSPTTGEPSDADSDPTYRVYKDGAFLTGQTGSMTLTDSSNTDGYYTATLTLSDANGYTVDSEYTIRITATVGAVDGATEHGFTVVQFATVDGSGNIASNVKAISDDTTAADNLELATDGTGYNVGGGLIVSASVTGGVGGNVTGSVGSVLGGINTTGGTITTLDGLDTAQDAALLALIGANGSGLTEVSLTDGAITADKFAADAITAGALSNAAAVEIRGEIDANSTQLAKLGTPSSGTIAGDISSIQGGNFRSTTVASVTSQTQLVLTAGPDFDDALNEQVMVLNDVTNNNYESVRVVTDYDGSTKTATINASADFTVAAADLVKLYPTSPRIDASIAAVESSVAGLTGGGNVLQHDIKRAFTFRLTTRADGSVVAASSVRLSSSVERPRFAFDVSPITESKPATVTNVEVLDSEGVASAGITVADEDNTANCGVRDYLVMSKVTGVSTSGTYTVRITFTTNDGSTLVVSGSVIVP